ncbi:crAss001_48 related protein [Limosilactobacillus mucosae]|uniref:crAss001_48 related protein n=1 Tax=Limosilactobacillus mucosae TaxID=97478 RepID=UPI0022DF3847|nr:hypothetical protein [Limosilactobacillus mucosae]
MENKELIKKLKKEQAKLDKKLLKLAIFLMDQEDSQTVSDLQLNLLNVQRDAMSAYSNVLEMRIDDLKGNSDAD